MISGGPLDLSFAAGFLKGRDYEYVIAVDGGLSACMDLGVYPDLVVGDFDTLGRETLEIYRKNSNLRFDIHEPEKDETDTELAVGSALKAGCTCMDVLGATGGRLDHEISNIHLLAQAKKRGLSVSLYDARNKICLLDSEIEKEKVFVKKDLYGKYVSFLPLTENVRGITLTGFKYPLNKKNISILENPSLCVSNELSEATAVMSFEAGILICVESHD